MKALLVAEYRDGEILGNYAELIGFAGQLGAESAMFLVGNKDNLPQYDGRLYLADVANCGEFDPDGHKQLLLETIEKENPDVIVFSHSSYGWDLAPRIAFALGAAQVSEVVEVVDGNYIVPACNAKLRRTVKSGTEKCVITLQAGAFNLPDDPTGTPEVIEMSCSPAARVEFSGYEQAEQGGVDLSKSEVIVSAGRGIGKPENVTLIADLAEALGGDYGASRPVVDSEWVEHNRQVGTTGQSVAPKLYMACGISGAIQHLAGMKKSDFIVAINTDKDAPIGEVADVLVVADLKQFVPLLTEKIKSM